MMILNKTGLAVFFYTLAFLMVVSIGSCKLDPKLEVEGIKTEDVGGPSENMYSFPVYDLSDLNVSQLQNNIVAVMMRQLLIVIDPVLRTYRVYNLGATNVEFVKVAPGGGKILIVTELTGTTGDIQFRAVVWNVQNQSEEFNDIFYGDVRDVAWDILADDIIILGKKNGQDFYNLYGGEYGYFRDVTSTYIELPFGYDMVAPGISEITTSYGYYGSLYATIVTRRSASTSSSNRYFLTRYERSNRFVTELRDGYNSCNSLVATRNDDYLLYRYNGDMYLHEAYRTTATQLSASVVIPDNDNVIRYCIDNNDENIYSVDRASSDIRKYNIQSDSYSTIPLIMEEEFTLDNFHFVK